VVAGSIPSGVIAVGNPARVVRELADTDVADGLLATR
jgi:acetyltransferase-like isoleucine patch superfamily enzyme